MKKVVDVLDKRYADFVDPRDNIRGGVSAEPPASSGRRG